MKIYVSLPISNKDIKIQASLAKAIAKNLKEKGHTPMNPFEVQASPSHLDEKEQYAYYMGEDMKMLLTCDAILMVDRKWTKSKGCTIEHDTARTMGMTIFYNLSDVPYERVED